MNHSQPFMYAEPRNVRSREDCLFYHRMQLPGVGVVGEQWDLRDSVDDYLGQYDFAGKRVLDIGAGSGYLSFEMERRGAEVVSFDAASGTQWNIVPHDCDPVAVQEIGELRCQELDRLKNAYWYSHRLLKSRAAAYYGDVYDLPEELGTFDVVLFGMVLGHLRDPFQALYSGARLSRESVIVTNQTPTFKHAYASFMPTRENGLRDGWWSLSRLCMRQVLGVLGFNVDREVSCEAKCLVQGRTQSESCTAFVASKIAASGSAPADPQQRHVA